MGRLSWNRAIWHRRPGDILGTNNWTEGLSDPPAPVSIMTVSGSYGLQLGDGIESEEESSRKTFRGGEALEIARSMAIRGSSGVRFRPWL